MCVGIKFGCISVDSFLSQPALMSKTYFYEATNRNSSRIMRQLRYQPLKLVLQSVFGADQQESIFSADLSN